MIADRAAPSLPYQCRATKSASLPHEDIPVTSTAALLICVSFDCVDDSHAAHLVDDTDMEKDVDKDVASFGWERPVVRPGDLAALSRRPARPEPLRGRFAHASTGRQVNPDASRTRSLRGTGQAICRCGRFAAMRADAAPARDLPKSPPAFVANSKVTDADKIWCSQGGGGGG